MGASPLAEVELHFVDNMDTLFKFRDWAGERRETPIAFDTESAGLKPERDALRLIQLGDMRHGWAFPPGWHGAALEVLKGYEGELTAHNLPHDYRFLYRQAGLALPWHKLHDTLLLASLDDPMRARGLKPLSRRLVDPRVDVWQKALDDGMKKMKWDWGTVPFDFGPYIWYAALDPVLTAHLWHQLHPKVKASCPEAYDLELGVNRICTRMMLRGIQLDTAYVAAARLKLERYAADARAWLKEAYGITSVLSARQISGALLEHGEPPVSFTATGLPQMNKDFLKRVRDSGRTPQAREIARQVLGVRHAEKMMSSYLDNFTKHADGNGTVRCSIWQAEAVTGRTSITEPALQTLSRDDSFIRGSFVPSPGNVFISCDYSQIEARLAAHYSEDPGMIQTFADSDAGGPDFFAAIASRIWNRKIEKEDPERQLTKNVVYGAVYGAGVQKMADTAGVPFAAMKPVKDAFDAAFPGLRTFTDRIVGEARETAEREGRPAVRSGMGRYLPVEPRKEYVAVNRIIQAEAAEVLKRAMLDLDASGLGNAMVLPIHDEILFDLPREDAEEAKVVIQRTMSELERYRVPLTASATVLPERWAK